MKLNEKNKWIIIILVSIELIMKIYANQWIKGGGWLIIHWICIQVLNLMVKIWIYGYSILYSFCEKASYVTFLSINYNELHCQNINKLLANIWPLSWFNFWCNLLFSHTHTHIYIKIKLLTIVKGDLECSLFNSYYTKVMGGCYFFLSIVPLYPWYIPYNTVLNKEVSTTIFFFFSFSESLVWLEQGLNPGLPSHWWTLSTR